MDFLNTKFKHKTWYKGSNLTWKDFLELASESCSFFINKIPSKNQSNCLIDDLNYDVVLKNESGKSYVRLTKEQYEYYKQRKQFWENWHENYSRNNFKGKYNFDYIQAENKAKKEVKEYAMAVSKIVI